MNCCVVGTLLQDKKEGSLYGILLRDSLTGVPGNQ